MESNANKKAENINSVLLVIVIAILGGLIYGFIRTLFNTLLDFMHENHEYSKDAALLFFILVYFVSKVVVNWKQKKGRLAHQPYKSIFHIVGLLLLVGLVLRILWHLLKYSGLLQI